MSGAAPVRLGDLAPEDGEGIQGAELLGELAAIRSLRGG